MTWFKFVVLLISTLIVQTVLMPYLKVFGVAPDLLLVVVTISAIAMGRKYGVIVGAIAGFLQDIFSSTVYIHTISKIMVGYIIGFIKENVLGGEEAISAVTVFLVSIISAVIDVVMLYFFVGRPTSTFYYVLLTIVIYSFYNIISVPVFYPIMKATVLSDPEK
ncbi:rod shape-determining protein MreD [Candidatus Margulisiibacteriota bacterium]